MFPAKPSLCFSPSLPLSLTSPPSSPLPSLLSSPLPPLPLSQLPSLPPSFHHLYPFPKCVISPLQIPSLPSGFTSFTVFNFHLKALSRHSNRCWDQSLSFDSLHNYRICIAVIFFSDEPYNLLGWVNSLSEGGCSRLAFQHYMDSRSCTQCFQKITFCYPGGSEKVAQRRQKSLSALVVLEVSLRII